MSQDGRDIDFIYNLYRTFFARYFRQAAYDYSLNQFVAHFPCEFRRVEIFLDVLYKIFRALPHGFRFVQFCFQFRDLCFQSFPFFGIFLDKTDTDILVFRLFFVQ